MTEHIYEVHENCQELHCHICDGGLAVCTVCGGAEGSLATECPGVRQTAQQSDQIYYGELDFKDGRWIGGNEL